MTRSSFVLLGALAVFLVGGTTQFVLNPSADSVGAAALADTACLSVHSVTFNPTEAGATNDFVSLAAVSTTTGDASFSTTEANEDQFIAPKALRANTLRVDVATAPGAGNDDWKVTLRDDAASTALTCSVDETATSCADTSNTPAIVSGSKLAFLVDSSGAAADPTATAEMTISFCLTDD